MKQMYEFSVALDERYVRVVAADKLSASKEGARKLGVVWKERARDMVIIQGRKVNRREAEAAAPQISPHSPATSKKKALDAGKGRKGR